MCDRALTALGDIGSSAAADAIAGVLDAGDLILRRSAAKALARVGDMRAADPLVELLTQPPQDSWSEVDWDADELLAGFLNRSMP